MSKVQTSIVIPVYNEEGNLTELYKQLREVLDKQGKEYELIFVNDASRDKSPEILRELNGKDKKVKVINLSRNFGQQAAVMAGLAQAKGEVVATIDADLQDPPEVLGKMLEKIAEDYDVVYGVSKVRRDPPIRKLLFGLYYFLMCRLSSITIPRNVGIFAVMRRPVVEALLSLPERNRFIPALRTWVGFKQLGQEYEKPPRFAGKQSQNFAKLAKMAFDAIFSFSYVPLRLATYIGFAVSIFAFLVIVDVLYAKLVAGTAVLGWASPLVSTLFIGGIQLLILGVIGEYLGRIYDEVKQRPTYVISEKIGFND
ncbi:glycosyltransferase family 2 protein [Patescibacteria group bacterium]|nr:glycosyltransferase family 2 protein [Patescibacteria group bacterium]